MGDEYKGSRHCFCTPDRRTLNSLLVSSSFSLVPEFVRHLRKLRQKVKHIIIYNTKDLFQALELDLRHL